MASQLNPRLLSFYRELSRVASGIVLAVGFLVLVAWLFDISQLKSILPGLATMKANTALAFVLAGLSLWLAHKRRVNKWVGFIAKGCATLTALIGLLTLSEYVLSRDLGIDQLLFKDTLTPENAYPGRMSPVTALNLSLLGFALLILNRHQYQWPVEVFGLGTLLISVLALIGYAYGVPSLYQYFPYSSIAIHTALAFSTLCVGILFARPERGLMKIFSSDDIGGVMARRLMPGAIVAPFVLGWLLLTGQRMGLYDSTFRLALFSVSTVIVFAILIWWNASLLQQADLVRQQTQTQLSETKEREAAILYASLDAVITMDHQGLILEFNPAAQNIFGYDRAEVLGREMSELIIPPVLREQHRKGLEKYLATGEGPVLGKRIELPGMRADGTEFPVELTITPITGGEHPVFTGFVRDITERKQAEEKIAYQAYLLENVNDAVIGSDENSIIRFWNQGAERIFGWKAEEVLGRSGREILRSEILNTDRETVLKILVETGRWKGEALQYRKDGTQVTMEVSTITLRDANDQITGYVSVHRDITERKRAEQELRESEQKFSIIYDKAPFAAVLSSLPTGIIVNVNEAFERVFGYSKQDAMGKTSLELGINPDAEGRARITAELQTRGSVRDIELKLITKFDVERMFLVNIDLVGIGEERYALQTAQDITEHKRAEEEILNLNEELEQRVIKRTHLFEIANRRLEKSRKEIQNILDSMSTLNAKVALNGTLLFVNKIAIEASGLSAEELMKTNFLEGQWWAFDRDVQQRVKDAFAQACSGQTINYDEKIFVFGQVLTINFSLTPMLSEDGRVEYILAEGRDITKRIHAEEEIQRLNQDLEHRAAELETLNKELESFSYSVSHDLRAPLRSVDGYSQALLEDYSELLPTEGRTFLKHVRSSAHRMAELIDGLLDLSRVTRAYIKAVPVDLTRLAENILADLQRTDPARSVRCSVASNMNVRGDPRLLQIVLENLLNNAWKYTSKREQAEIEFGSKYENDGTIYFVRDNGAGFDMAYADKLFGAFQRLHTTTEFPGTGIGLATVQRIILRHGGRIWAESAVGQGATFFFTLPALEGAQPKMAPEEEDSIIMRAREII